MTGSGAGPADRTAVRDAYDAAATAYIDAFGSADEASAVDRDVIAGWSSTVTGPVLDAGCGPGHWSAFLHSLGLQVEGVDVSPAFIDHARRSNPQIAFRLGDLRDLDPAPGSLGGVLAWFSLIHLHPSEVPGVVRTFSKALRPGGGLLVGYFSGAELRPFDHRVVTGWTWPPARMQSVLEEAGLEVLSRNEHPQPSGRIFAETAARRPGDGASSMPGISSASRPSWNPDRVRA